MSGYLGSFVHQVDAKGRVALPASFRRGWRPVEEELRELIRKQPEARASVLALTAGALEVSTDKQGRILIPDRMRELVGLNREALFVGALNKIEIWDPRLFRDSTAAPDPKFDPFIESIFA
ncbi:MAG: hypothetical protein P8Y07_10090 [Gemmatimonadales bacterium]